MQPEDFEFRAEISGALEESTGKDMASNEASEQGVATPVEGRDDDVLDYLETLDSSQASPGDDIQMLVSCFF